MTIVNLKFSDIFVTNDKNLTISARGIGSCVCLVIYDRKNFIGGMMYAVLPKNESVANEINKGRYVDTAVPAFLKEYLGLGGGFSDFGLYLVGGAELGTNNDLGIGSGNVKAVKEQLSKLNLELVGSDVGGGDGRICSLDMSKGLVVSKIIGKEEKILSV